MLALSTIMNRMENYIFVILSRKALPTTDKDDRLIAAAAIIGDKSMPKTGYRTPAATGTPNVL
tara:strand:- start:62 stop:250 length:189 start_codon:yes stop_codon:yes gene_type:complete